MRYWVYMDGEVPGCYDPDELAAMPDFGETSMVCPSEGGIEERNWSRAGQFPDILSALERREALRPPDGPGPSAEDAVADPGIPKRPDDILEDASSRIFRHVTELMRELENRREERALTQSLQRQLIDLKNEVLALRERNKYLQDRAELIPGFEDREKTLKEQLQRLGTDLQERDQKNLDAERTMKKLEDELQHLRRSEAGLSEDLKRQSHSVEELSGQLAEKEFTLAKAFGLIRKLESTLKDILPASVAGIRQELPEYPDPSDERAPAEETASSPETDRVEDDRPGEEVSRAEVERPSAEPLVEDAPAAEASDLPPAADPAPPEASAEPDPVSQRGVPTSEPGPLPKEGLPEPAPPDPSAVASDPEPRTQGEVTPVPAPWQSGLKKATDWAKGLFGKKKPPSDEPPAAE